MKKEIVVSKYPKPNRDKKKELKKVTEIKYCKKIW